jgi:uncharacterized damage-inducible protein DinB
MTAIDQLKLDAAYGFAEFVKACEGVSEPLAWGILPAAGDEYLHTDGSIHSIVLHCASVKWMYGSICFRNTEIRWRDIAEQMDGFEPSWDAALDYCAKAHVYWMESWADLTDDRLEEMRPTNYTSDWPARRLIQMMNHHDSYHAGQITVLRYGVRSTDQRPPSVAEDVRKYCSESKHW